MTRRLTTTIATVAAVVPLALTGIGIASARAADAQQEPAANASVVRVDHVVPPRRKVVHHKFRPWARPTPRQVQSIIRAEARRWRIDPRRLANRVACESRFRWWASNGTYQGVLQFAPGTFHRGLRTIKNRRVVLVRERVRRVHETRVEHYSDGTTKTRRGRPRRQRVVYVYSGRLPKSPAVNHTWAQLRIGAQAIRGISAVHSSEWSCGA